MQEEKIMYTYKDFYYLYRFVGGKHFLGRVKQYSPFKIVGLKRKKLEPPEINWIIKRVKDELIKKLNPTKFPKGHTYMTFTDREVKEFNSFNKAELDKLHEDGK